MTLDLLKHQADDIAWAHRVGRGLLGNEPGTGKSRSMIEATAGMNRVLVIAPGLIIDSGNWQEELDRWAIDPTCYTLAPYSQLNDREKTAKGGNAPVRRLREQFRGDWDAVIVDEAHYTKGRKTSWTWAVDQIARRSGMLIEATGTPIPNWSHELFTILQAIYPEESGRGQRLGSFWRWAKEWFDCSPTRFSNGNPVVGEMLACSESCLELPATSPCEHYRAFTEANLGERFRRVLRSECLDLPPLTEQTVQTPMSTAQARIYRELKKDFSTTVSGTEVLAWSQGAKNVLLDKVTTSPWLLAPDGEPRGGKFDRLEMDLQGREMPTLVMAHYRSTVEACARVAGATGRSAAFIHGGTDSKANGAAVRDFKAGKIDVLVGSLETISEGLTLTVADMAIFVETSYKPSRNEQARFRVHRMGQTKPVTVLDYVTPGTVDERKRRLLATKSDRMMRVLTAAEFGALL